MCGTQQLFRWGSRPCIAPEAVSGASPHLRGIPFHRMEELGLHPADRQVYFGQLLGMCDQISFPLGELGLPGLGGMGAPWWGWVYSQLHLPCVQARQASLCTSMCPMAP